MFIVRKRSEIEIVIFANEFQRDLQRAFFFIPFRLRVVGIDGVRQGQSQATETQRHVRRGGWKGEFDLLFRRTTVEKRTGDVQDDICEFGIG